jgi:transcriptional regulator with XRE-family HTH domain
MKRANKAIRLLFAKNLKKHREVLRYSQEKLAEKADLSVQTIKDIEGNRRWVSDSSLYRLAKALNINVFQLFLPEKFEKDARYKKAAIKNLIILKEKIKDYINKQVEEAVNKGDFT